MTDALHILVAEDNDFVRTHICNYLGDANHKARIACGEGKLRGIFYIKSWLAQKNRLLRTINASRPNLSKSRGIIYDLL